MASLKRWLDRRRNPWKGVFHDAYKAWKRDKGQARLERYDLSAGAVVFDFGGYVGAWTEDVLRSQPEAVVHVFEPHPGFAKSLHDKFANHNNVHVHSFALGAEDGHLTLSDAGDASSAVADHATAFEAEIRSLDRFFADNDIPDIALAKMNIEGGEYDLLPALIDSGIMARIGTLQVQFHLFEPRFSPVRDEIRKGLAVTHSCDWEYPFVWEQWSVKTG
ncbi:hypothetical protein ASD8599_01960 [Ascidiaceihabitans donghaensis]|uniref:Methyltransferase FkbM domain-containing protein n=1 Tax=Ascidiaceihabitans donghaensis TaxID=1510460 RepID=A0A2R8BDQ2_9RHOB|nr:FkbM family methyltransferase [Ascidiaceihabitans donghaensis]SPH21211.1 hypothetical protein ASD8599_01960 [Ascidiaceihabitans donghaensis]